MNLSCNFEFSGFSDYWGGMGGRGCGKGCAFAFYGRETTLRDIVDQWVEETWANDHDFADLPESVSQEEIRDCIVSGLTAAGRADYDSGALCEWAANLEDNRECRSCGECIGDPHCDDCDAAAGAIVEECDCDDDDDCGESPQVILCIDWTDHPDYKPESDWELCQHDDGHWLWANKYGRETGPYSDENAAWADMPDCDILREDRG